jgi:hypothetical protein
MKHFLLVCVCVLTSAALQAETECEDAVDMADSLDFHAMHVECADDPVNLYDPESKSNFFSKQGKVVTAYAEPSPKTSAAPTPKATESTATESNRASQEVQKETNNAGVTFNIRAPFTLVGGPQSAMNGLYVQMAQYCGAGWNKQKEWVVAAKADYFLHYQFTCAE